MAEVGFYHLTRTGLEDALPKLLERARSAGHRIVLRVPLQERLDALDRQLWTYANDSFLPHGGKDEGFGPMQPIWLTTGTDNPNGATVLALADGAEMAEGDAFARVLDLFDGNSEEAVAAARQRWKAAKAQGHKLVYWQQDEQGRWNRAAESGGDP